MCHVAGHALAELQSAPAVASLASRPFANVLVARVRRFPHTKEYRVALNNPTAQSSDCDVPRCVPVNTEGLSQHLQIGRLPHMALATRSWPTFTQLLRLQPSTRESATCRYIRARSCDYRIQEVRAVGARLDDSIAQRMSHASVAVLSGRRMTPAPMHVSLFPARETTSKQKNRKTIGGTFLLQEPVS